MPGPPWSAGTRMFSSVDDSSDSSDTSSECWNPRSPGEYSIGSRPSGGDVSPSKLALPALATALRASRARAAAAQAKASRLLEETGRLRDALKVARKGEEKANRYETELAKSEVRARELESDNRRLRRDLDGARFRTRQNEAKARSSLSTLRTSLEDLEQEQRARCKRWRATTRSQRALLESLRRHVQRGLHSAPSFTAFQLIEQIFACLETLESDAQLSPARRRRQRSPSAACSPPADPLPPRRGGSPKRSPHVAAGGGGGPQVTVKGLTPTPSSVLDPFNDEDDADLRTGRGGSLRAAIGGAGGGGGGYFSSDGDGDGSGGGGSNGSQEDFQAQEGGGGRTTARFSTEWAYRLAVTKLTAQLKAARERLHGEKEAARSAGERVEQEELRCRQLEVEVEGLSSKVAAADGHRRRLEAMLKETKRERDALRRRQNSTAATQALSAALGVLHQRQASSSPAYPQPPPPPPPPAFAATPQAPVAATAPASRAPAVYPATESEALYNHGGDAPRLEPSALASAYSPDGGSGGAWWEGGEGTGVEPRYGQRHQPQQHTAAPNTGDGFPGSPAPAVRGGAGREPPRSARNAESAGVGGRELLTQSEIQRIVDDAVMNGTVRRGTGDGGGGDDVAGVGDSRAAGAELSGVGYRWRDTAPGYGTSSLLGDGGGGGGGGRKSAAAAAAAAPTAAAAFSGRRRDTAWLSSRPPATAIGRTPAERGIGAGAARVGGPPPRPKATSSEVGGGKNGGGGSVRFGGGSSLGPRAVTREDLTRLDNEIANLSKTVEQAAMAQTRQILRNVAE